MSMVKKIVLNICLLICLCFCINAQAVENSKSSAVAIQGNTEGLQRHAIETKARMMFNGAPVANKKEKMSDYSKYYRG